MKNKLSIIIDVHDFDELFKDPKENIPKFMAIWTQLSYHYAKAPPEVIFEIINEPQLKLSGSLANKVQHDALAIIRQHNPTRTVILAGDHWGAMEGMDNLKLPPNDSNIVATVHYYNPFEFTVQGAEWLKEEAPPKGRHWPLKGEMQKLNDDISEIYNWREKLGVEVLIGEYGTDAAVPQNLRVSWKQYDVTHLPEMDGDQLVGIVDESDVVMHVYGDESKFRDKVATAMVTKLDKLDVKSPIEALLPVFDKGPVAIVTEADRFLGLITRIDLLNYLRRRVQ